MRQQQFQLERDLKLNQRQERLQEKESIVQHKELEQPMLWDLDNDADLSISSEHSGMSSRQKTKAKGQKTVLVKDQILNAKVELARQAMNKSLNISKEMGRHVNTPARLGPTALQKQVRQAINKVEVD